MALEPIWTKIEDRYDDLSPQMRRAARYVRGNPQDVALGSLRSLARNAGVSPSAMTRLIRILEFSGFDDFRQAHQDWLTGNSPAAFSSRADRLIARSGSESDRDDLVAALAEGETANILASLAPDRRGRLREAAEMILGARHVAVLGIRSCFPVAFSLHYSLSLFLSNVRLLAGTGGVAADELYLLDEGDVLVATTVSPYSRQVVDAVALARRRGISVIAITDDHLSPIARTAEIALVAENAGPSHIAAPTAPIMVGQALAMLVLVGAGKTALATMRRREAMLRQSDAYTDDNRTGTQ